MRVPQHLRGDLCASPTEPIAAAYSTPSSCGIRALGHVSPSMALSTHSHFMSCCCHMQTGQRVVYSKYAGTEVAMGEDEHILLKVRPVPLGTRVSAYRSSSWAGSVTPGNEKLQKIQQQQQQQQPPPCSSSLCYGIKRAALWSSRHQWSAQQ
jgi:hypothetical protein